MKANIAYQFELMPTREQKRILAQAAGCRRFVWNKTIELQKLCLENKKPCPELEGHMPKHGF